MNKGIKKLWLERLRSGEIEQGTQGLAPTKDSRCCLGVLCDIAVEEGILERIPTEKKNLYYEYRDRFAFETKTGLLPRRVLKWAELGADNRVVVPTKFNPERTLVTLNDRGVNFEKIANIIERRL